jgi:2-isopropylmalate synthase
VPIPVTKAIVGGNAFAHESGIHQHGVLSNPMTYEIMTPQSVGKTESSIVLGKLSGQHAFTDRLRSLGYDNIPKEELDKAFVRFKELADRKKNITDEDLEALVNLSMDIPEHFKLESFQIQSGNILIPMASVALTTQSGQSIEAATGDGPIDAAYNAIVKIVGKNWELTSYDIKAVTGGMDALGEVTVRIGCDNKYYTGRGLSTDIIEASILAYINAINRAMAKDAA